jgi:hypothetical protein
MGRLGGGKDIPMASHIIYLNATLPAPPQVVWDILADVDNADRVFRSVSGSEKLTEGPYDVGTTWHEKRTMFGHHGEEELHVVECEAPSKSVIETKLGHDTVRTSYRLTPMGPRQDRTRLAMTTTVATQDRTVAEKLAWNFFGSFSHERTRKMLQHDLEDLEAECDRRITSGS